MVEHTFQFRMSFCVALCSLLEFAFLLSWLFLVHWTVHVLSMFSGLAALPLLALSTRGSSEKKTTLKFSFSIVSQVNRNWFRLSFSASQSLFSPSFLARFL